HGNLSIEIGMDERSSVAGGSVRRYRRNAAACYGRPLDRRFTTSPRGNTHCLQNRPSRRKVNTDGGGADAIPEERARMWIAVARELDRGAELSGQTHHARRAVRRRRADGQPGADFRRAPEAVARPDDP